MVLIRKVPCPTNKYSIKCPYSMEPECIIIHNTANDAPAINEINYMHRNNNQVSFHYAVDDKEIVQGIEHNRNTWNAGDGKNGKGNRTGIAIEICYSKSGGERFEKAQENAAELTAGLLKQYGWGIDKVSKHQDYNGKHCPHRTLDDYGWNYFLNLVKKYMSVSDKPDADENVLYRVQTGAFSNPDNADNFADMLNDAGFQTYIVKVDNLFKVQVGAYAVRENAENMLDNLNKSGYDGFITTNGVPTVETKPEPEKPIPQKKSVDEIAREILAGKGNWGDGETRKQRLREAGYDPKAVQDRINEIKYGTANPSVNPSVLPARGYFKKGDKSPTVGKIAKFMRATFPAYTSEKALGDYYGDYLISAIKEFQRRTGLTPDGCTGKITLAKLQQYGLKI